MSYTKQEREILDSWPTVTAQDLEAMNGLFSHYLFFSRAGDLMGLSGINLWASCCGHKEARPYLTRTQDQEHWTLMDLRHKARLTCPWCGRKVTAIDLSRVKGRKSLRQTELTVLLRAKGDALYCDLVGVEPGSAMPGDEAKEDGLSQSLRELAEELESDE